MSKACILYITHTGTNRNFVILTKKFNWFRTYINGTRSQDESFCIGQVIWLDLEELGIAAAARILIFFSLVPDQWLGSKNTRTSIWWRG